MLKNETKFNFEALNYVGLTYFDIQKIEQNDNIFTKSEFSQKFQKIFFLPFSGPNFG